MTPQDTINAVQKWAGALKQRQYIVLTYDQMAHRFEMAARVNGFCCTLMLGSMLAKDPTYIEPVKGAIALAEARLANTPKKGKQ